VLRAALTIAGLDPSGGAGIAADLRAFHAAGVWGCAVCACLTVQSTRGVRAVHPVAPRVVGAQAVEILEDVRIGAIKTGALGSAAVVREVAKLARGYPLVPLVVDPVMIPSRLLAPRARLDGPGALPAMRRLLKHATLVTPNLAEASALLGESVDGGSAADAALELVRLGARAALVKGGHARGAESIDLLATRSGVAVIAGPRRRTPPLHGTGCTLAALIAGKLAGKARRSLPSDAEIEAAARWARRRLDQALRRPQRPGNGLALLDVQRSS
jgi:hydroxymethylpyrimidine/phosphomethylpyrimidine kinase